MGGVDFAEDGGLDAHAVAALDIDQLEGDARIDCDATSEITEVYDFLGHLLIIILMPTLQTPSDKIMLHTILLAKIVHHIQQLIVILYLVPVDVDALDIFIELNRPVDLHLFVSTCAI